jgi:hypothetical protein
VRACVSIPVSVSVSVSVSMSVEEMVEVMTKDRLMLDFEPNPGPKP